MTEILIGKVFEAPEPLEEPYLAAIWLIDSESPKSIGRFVNRIESIQAGIEWMDHQISAYTENWQT